MNGWESVDATVASLRFTGIRDAAGEPSGKASDLVRVLRIGARADSAFRPGLPGLTPRLRQ